MEKFLKSRFFVFIVILTLSLVLIPAALSLAGVSSPIRSAINLILTPVQRLSQAVTDAIAGYVSYFADFDKLVKENADLKQQLSDLREQVDDAIEIKALNDWLYNYLEIKRLNPDYQFLDATVTGRSSNNFANIFTLDRGTSAGVRVNMPVLTNDGLVGYVSEVGINWCKVKTLFDYDASIGVKDKRSGVIGVLESSYELSRQGQCRMIYLEPDANVKVGDTVVTSGFSEMYPPGLIIGYVSAVEHNASSRSLEAIVTVVASFDDAEKVMILVDYGEK
ncbi:MAG: rod shape-determining protein MreC [Clostridia bacterium]|nr:rod shape-determining protein MreC [Clostridia bacterium]